MKKIVIIGASSGLGARIATDYARRGWRVGIAARRTDMLSALKQRYPENIEYMTIDVGATDAVKRFYELIELIDGMDVLLYAAGTGFQDLTLDEVRTRQTLTTNVLGFTAIVDAAFNYFRDTANLAPGQIAVITSIAGTKGMGAAAAYSASKRYEWIYIDALEQLAHIQHVNVRFTDIRPGFVRTSLLDPDKSYPMIMSVDYAAPRIERAIDRHRRVAVIDSRWRVITALWRLIPRCLWKRLNITN
ncbi:MAG: SDR family NAD(P)-dependent oxidoreductase [Paramuribaculum sp.]|nr:SDR family NAD(P)-dependent oxidoreductase [Paramuribaculum sp.]